MFVISKSKKFIFLAIVLMAVLLINTFAFAAEPEIESFAVNCEKTSFSANVMAPLHVMNYNNPNVLEDADWQSFKTELETAKGIGVDAVSVDVWWGDVEGKGDNKFDWQYYKKVFKMITDAKLKLMPIMSFHQCGGNVGDTYTSKLPSWVWEKIKSRYDVEDLKYMSELGNYSDEYVSLWADDLVMNQYREFIEAFADFCDENNFSGSINELNISCGPAGELRYPSYNSHDWIYDASTGSGFYEKRDGNGNVILRGDRTNWPHRGAVQWYGDLSLQDFKDKMKDKYKTIARLKAAWDKYGKEIKSFDDIQFPDAGTDHGYPDKKVFKADALFQSGDYYKSQFGRDLIEWYNQSLVDHGKRMIETADKALNKSKMKRVPLGIKVPGVHWQMGTLGSDQPVAPRAAEIAAGLVKPGENFKDSFDLNSEANTDGHGYANIISTCKDSKHKVNLHFTCLEMGNSQSGGSGETPNQYSLAKALVGWVAAEAYKQGVTIKGENALSGGLPWVNEDFPGDWVDAWDHIGQALERYPYEGITVLRMTDVTTVTNPQNGKTVGKDHYQALIEKMKSGAMEKDKVTIYYKASEKKGEYTLCTLGQQGSEQAYKMSFDGERKGDYWWKVTITAPDYFKFYFKGSKGKADKAIRVYMRYPNNDNNITPINTIYVKAADPVIYSSQYPQ